VFCFDFDGKELWRKNIDATKIRYNWGPASSPVLHGDMLYILNDNDEDSYLLALDKKTGKQAFRIERDEKSNWTTPYIWKNNKRTELVTSGSVKVRSYDLGGNLLWELGGMSSIDVPTPVEKDGLLYVCSGFDRDRRARPIFAIRPGATGDITLKKDQTSSEYIAWHDRWGGTYNPSPIAYGDYFYVLYDRGTVSCYDARTGKKVYDQQRLAEDAKAFTASPWASNGKIYFLSEHGDTFVIKAGPRFEVIARNPLKEMAMATPATLRGSIVIRTLNKLYKIGK
jgi:outer membrane protein assembly factor BamB